MTQSLLCIGVSELSASSWDTCSETSGVSLVCGWELALTSKVHPADTHSDPGEWSMISISLNWARLPSAPGKKKFI